MTRSENDLPAETLGWLKQSGFTVRFVNQNVEIDLTDQTIAELLARHLLPRLRAVMRRCA